MSKGEGDDVKSCDEQDQAKSRRGRSDCYFREYVTLPLRPWKSAMKSALEVETLPQKRYFRCLARNVNK